MIKNRRNKAVTNEGLRTGDYFNSLVSVPVPAGLTRGEAMRARLGAAFGAAGVDPNKPDGELLFEGMYAALFVAGAIDPKCKAE